ncbi:MAG: tetratricopeptide repeat protein [Candidatus Kapaibacterium sp.]|nr:MAG: tetratricopeptide repeat protein [Candidatus Kapabacteria bacterium]
MTVRNFYIIIFFCCIIATSPVFAQFSSPRAVARSGNEAYTNGRFKEAETSYREALKQDTRLTEGTFNLGDALYKQKKYEESADQFRLLADNSKAPRDVRSQSYYNLGNSFVQGNKLQEAVNAYKSSLRLNPSDDEARSNLAYAQKMLLQQQQQQQQNQKNDENKQDKQDQQQQNQQQQNQQQNDPKQNQQQNQQQQQQSQTQPKLSKADAERILDALNNDEKNIQKRLIKRKAAGGVVIEKDW